MAAPAILIPLTLWSLAQPSRWLICFFATAFLLPPLPIALGDSGPHVCLLFAGFGLLCGVLWLPRWQVSTNPVQAPMLALFFILLASVAPAAIHSGATVAAGSLARVALFGIAVYVFYYTSTGPGSGSGTGEMLQRVYWIAVVSALLACIDFYYQLPAPSGYSPQFVWLESGVYRRAQGVFYDAGTLGNFCAFFLVLIAAAVARPFGREVLSRKALTAGGAIFFATLVLSYSRSSLLNVLIALAALAWLNRRRMRLARLTAVLAIGGAAAALLTWKLFPEFLIAYWARVSASTEFFFSATEGVLSGRLASWYSLRDWIAAHPWQALVGIGYKTLPYTNYLGAPVVGDNMYLTLLVETGILGLAVLLWLHIAVLRCSVRAASSSEPRRALLGTWIFCFWCGQAVQMFSVDLLTFWRVLPVYFWVLALVVHE